MSKQWYVVHTYSGHENKVKSNLERKVATLGLQDKICQVIIPLENVAEVKEGKRVTTARKFFPGYILVEMELDDQTWEVIRNLPGVSGFIGAGNRPVPLKPTEFATIKERMEDKGDKPRPKLKFQKGDTVKVVEGRNIDLVGTIEEIDEEKGRLKIGISILGRTVSTDVDILQVELV
ncbi:MAG: transcription termination/antitermination protein NusG [bacterium]